jgi:tetratricopeptide (TPR) repeat protein
MSGLFGNRNLGKELPRPQATTTLLWITGILAGLCGAAACAWTFVTTGLTLSSVGLAAVYLVAGLVVEGITLGIALIVKYTFTAALSTKLTERAIRDVLERSGRPGEAPAPISNGKHEEVVSLLSEIMENTLLDEEDKASKRELAKRQRQQALRREIEALVAAGRFPDARERLDDFRLRYRLTGQVAELEAHLAEAIGRQGQTEVTQISEQVQKYMSLGLWDRAMQIAKRLAEQYPESPEASRLPEAVRLEQAANRRQEQQRIYREIEHLVARKHWRQALDAAKILLESHADSPEAAKLKEQMEELKRNADVVERREWEARITDHVQAGRHREAYELAVELMAKYPDSPQAAAIRERLDQLKARAGITE